MADEIGDADIAMDARSLYREELFTDRRVGTLQRLTPVTAAGADDPARAVLFVGQTQILTPAGALPLSFEIPAKSLDDAVKQFGDYAKKALESTMRRIDELRREQASSIIVPGSQPPQGGGFGGGMGGGGRFR